MKKLLIVVILATACQFTFANNDFNHERVDRRYREAAAPRACERVVYVAPHHRHWVRECWVVERGCRRRVPSHWEY